MGQEVSDEALDDVLQEVLQDGASDTVTIAQSVADTERKTVTDEYIEGIAAELDVPAAAEQMAKSLRDQYRDQRGSLTGTALEVIATSCLYCACKASEVPLSPMEFVRADDTVVSRRALLRRSKDVATTVGLDPAAFVGSSHYIDRYCEELDVSEAVRERAHTIVEVTEDQGLASGKRPSGWAAAAIYNAGLDTGAELTQTALATRADVSEPTLRSRYREQRDALDNDRELLPDYEARIDALCADLGFGEKIRQEATEALERRLAKTDARRKHAKAIIPATVYLVANQNGERVSYEHVGAAVDVSGSSVASARTTGLERIVETTVADGA